MKLEIERYPDDKRSELKEWYDKNKVNESLKFEFDNDSFIALKVDGNIVGIMSIQETKNKYSDFRRFILEEYRGSGLGEILLNYLICLAKQSGISKIKGILVADNKSGQKYLSSKGFKVTPFLKDKKQMVINYSATLDLRKNLN